MHRLDQCETDICVSNRQQHPCRVNLWRQRLCLVRAAERSTEVNAPGFRYRQIAAEEALVSSRACSVRRLYGGKEIGWVAGRLFVARLLCFSGRTPESSESTSCRKLAQLLCRNRPPIVVTAPFSPTTHPFHQLPVLAVFLGCGLGLTTIRCPARFAAVLGALFHRGRKGEEKGYTRFPPSLAPVPHMVFRYRTKYETRIASA